MNSTVNMEIPAFMILIERLREILWSLVASLPNIGIAIVVIVATWLAARVIKAAVRRAAKRARMRHSLQEALRTITGILVWFGGILIAATVALPGLSPADIFAGLGIGSLAVALAFRDIFENFLAGIMIMIRKPMRIGDHIECQDVEGEVQRISLRDSYVRRTDGVLILVPNAYLFKNPCRVLTDLDQRRVTIIVGISYDDDVDQAREVLTNAVKDLSTVEKSRPLQIFAREFAESAVEFEVTWWTGSRPVQVRKSKDEVVAAVKRSLEAAGIEIPVPYRKLVFGTALPLSREERSDH